MCDQVRERERREKTGAERDKHFQNSVWTKMQLYDAPNSTQRRKIKREKIVSPEEVEFSSQSLLSRWHDGMA